MAVSISAMFKLVDQISDRMEKIGSVGDKAMAKIEKSASKADQAFTKSQSSVNKLSAVYKNFEGNAEQLADAVQRGEKVLSAMEKTEGDTAASTFEFSSKIEAATKAQKDLEQAMQTANTAAKNYETVVNDNSSTAQEFIAAEEALDNATRDLFTAFDKGAEAALDLEEASDKAADKVKGFGKEADEAARKGEEFGDKTSSAIQSVESLLVTVGITKLLSEITGALLDCSAAAETVETSSAKLETLAGSQNMSMLSDQIYTISAATGEAQEGLYEVAYNAISAGTDVKQAAEITEAATKLATAGFTSSSSALSVLTTATNSYGKAAGSATDITDGLITVQNLGVTTVGELANSMGKSISTAAAYNVSLNNLESAYISVTKAGINTQEGTTYINAMINELGKSSSEVAKILTEETGKSFGELMTSGYSLADVLEIIYNKAGQNSEAMMNLWGSQTAAVASAAIVNQGLDTFNSNLDTVKNSAGATAKAYRIMADTTEYAHNKMTNSANNLKISVGQQLNPSLTKFYNLLSGIMDSSSEFVNNHPWVVKALASIAVGLTAVTTGLAVATVAVKAMEVATATLGVTINTALPVLGLIAAAISLITFTVMACTDQEETMTATFKSQEQELDRLNRQYDDTVEKYGVISEEASTLKYKIDDLTEAHKNTAKTLAESVEESSQMLKSAEDRAQGYYDTIDQIDNQRNSIFALIQKLDDLVKANDGTADSENRIKSVIEELNTLLPELSLNFENVVNGGNSYVDVMKRAAEIQYNNDKYSTQLQNWSSAKAELEANQNLLKSKQADYDAIQAERGYYYYDEDPAGSNRGAGYYSESTYRGEAVYHKDDQIYPNTVIDGVAKDVYAAYDALQKTQSAIETNQQLIDEIEADWAEAADAAEFSFNHPADAAEAATNALNRYENEIKELCTAYGEAYDAALESFNGQFGLFDEVITKSEEGAETLTAFEQSTVESAQKALESQLEYWTQYNESIETVKTLTAGQLGLTENQYKDFMAYIQDGSEEAAGLAYSMSEKIKSGNTEAVENLAQTYVDVKEQQEKAADTVADWQTDFYDKLDGIKTKMEDTIDGMELDEEAKNAAKFTIEAYAQSLKDNMGTAVAAATDVKTAVTNALFGPNTIFGLNFLPISSDFGYAEGTDYATRGVHLVGENGPELVIFNGGEQVIPHDDTDAILNRSGDNLSVPESLLSMPTTTYSDSDADRESKKVLDININGQGKISIDGSTSKDEVIALVYEYAKPAIMDAIADEIIVEGEDSYDY